MKKFFPLIVAVLVAGPAAAEIRDASADAPRRLAINRTDRAPTIDGVLDEAVWAGAEKVELPFEFQPGNNVVAPVTTRCSMTYDERRLYFACEADDPEPERIRALVTARDNYDGQDAIALSIDTFASARRSYEFFITPFGVQSDGVFDQAATTFDLSWDTVWESAGRITTRGYTVEAAIPFKSLRFPDIDGQAWGFYFRRAWPRSRAHWMRSARMDPSLGCLLCQADQLSGITGVQAGRNLELTPTATATRTDRTGITGVASSGPMVAAAGLDLRWGVTSDLTVNATVNPDFSQVEADAQQLDANTRFTLSYPERRPFFVENADLFTTLMTTVFTRSIADPVAGLKVTGSRGRTVGGVVVVRDAATNVLLPESQRSVSTVLPGESTDMIGRVRHDFGTVFTVGALASSRDGEGGYFNRLGSVDLFARPFRGLSLRSQLVATETAYPDGFTAAGARAGTTFGGHGFRAVLRYDTRDWVAQTTYSQRNDGYRADLGFEPQVDLRYREAWAQRNVWGRADGWYSKLFMIGGVVRENDYDGAPINHWQFLGAGYEGPQQVVTRVTARKWEETFRGVTHDISSVLSYFSLAPSRTLRGDVQVVAGHALDYESNQRARNLLLTSNVSVRPGVHLEVGFNLSRQHLTLPAGALLDANVSRLRAIYHFSNRTLVRAIVQRRLVERNPSLAGLPVTPRADAVSTQLLYSYRLTPLTALYLGYGDNWRADSIEVLSPVPLRQADRTFYVKVGYAWRP